MPLTAVAPFLSPSADVPLAEEVLDVLGRVRFVSRSSLLAYAQPLGFEPSTLDDWIAVGLVFHGQVRLDALKPDETDYLALTPAGARELALRGRKAEGVSSSRLARSPGKRAHDLCVGEVALTMFQAERTGLVQLVGLQVDDPRFGTSVVLARSDLALKRVALHADLIFAQREGDRRRAFLVEVDRGTISIDRMREKYTGYLEWWKSGGPMKDYSVKALQVLTIAKDARRAERLHDAALAANDGRSSGFLLFAEQQDFTAADPERLKQPIIRQLGATARSPLFTH